MLRYHSVWIGEIYPRFIARVISNMVCLFPLQELDMFSASSETQPYPPLSWRRMVTNTLWLHHQHSKHQKLHSNWANHSKRRLWMAAKWQVSLQWLEINSPTSKTVIRHVKLSANSLEMKWWPSWRATMLLAPVNTLFNNRFDSQPEIF